MNSCKQNGLDDIYFLIENSQHFASIVLNKKLLKFEDYYPYNAKFNKLEEQFQYAIRVLEHSILMMLALHDDVQRGIKSKDSRNRGIAKSIMSRKEKSDKRTKEIITAANKLLAEDIDQHSIAGILVKKFNVKIDTIRRALKQRHNWLYETWNHYIPDELSEELGSTMMVLSFFSSKSLAQTYYHELAQSSGQSLEQFANVMQNTFENALMSYMHLGRSIQTALSESQSEYHQPYINEQKIGRNEPCPCGSGKKYKKCCLH